MKKFKRGELTFYKTHLPKELLEFIKENPEYEERVNNFIKLYKFNYVKNEWSKQ